MLAGLGSYFWLTSPRRADSARRLFELSREKFAGRNWDELYTYTSEEWREEYIPLMRRHLEYLLRYAETETVDAQTAVAFSDQQVFRVWLEVYSQTTPGEKLLDNIEDIEIKRIVENEGKSIVHFHRPVEIPGDFKALVAGEKNGSWKIKDLKE